jgi:hypothetical protein
VLEEIRLLSGIETHKEKVLRIILAGQPELKETLASPKLKQLVQRIRLRFHVGPLDKREMREYIQHRLAIAGRGDQESALFDEDGFDVIFRYSGGVPRLINTLCDTALLCAFADEKPSVSADDVRAAVAELGWSEHASSTGLQEKLRQIKLSSGEEPHLTQIEVRSEGETLSVHTFPTGRVIIGRSPDNEIYIKSKFVSRHHAQLISDSDGCVIEDLNSTNGVFLGEKQVKKQRLDDGDVILLGIHELVYTDLRIDEAAPESDQEPEPAPVAEPEGEDENEDNLEAGDEASAIGK